MMRAFAAEMGWDLHVQPLGKLSACEQVELMSNAAVVLGVHGADIANAFFTPDDATLVEAYPVSKAVNPIAKLKGGAAGPWFEADTNYAVQMERAGRRHLSVRLFDVHARATACNPNASLSTDWQYRNDCSLSISLGRLRDVLDVLAELYTPQYDARTTVRR